MAGFASTFGRAPDVAATAPGRVNLMGEHTDYNDGLVLPMALGLRTTVELSPRADRRVRIATETAPDAGPREYLLGAEQRTRDWLDYIQGCTQVTAGEARITGFDAYVTSSVPVGAGLASSAALELALLRALRTAFGLPLDDVALARLAHRAEYDFVGARVGLMDQLAAGVGAPGEALHLDTRTLAFDRIPLPAGLALLVLDSGIAHEHAGGSYNERRAECERAAALLGVASLRDVDDRTPVASLPRQLAHRVRHVVTENARVGATADALRAGDLPALGALFVASHASQRDDYAVSVPAVDALVDIATAAPAVYGARLTGGGFGGSVVVAADAARAGGLADRIVDAYRSRTGAAGRVLVDGP